MVSLSAQAWCGSPSHRGFGPLRESGGVDDTRARVRTQPITIDAEKRALTLDIPSREIAARLKRWKQPKPRYTRGVLAKYAKTVSSAHLGAVTDAGD